MIFDLRDELIEVRDTNPLQPCPLYSTILFFVCFTIIIFYGLVFKLFGLIHTHATRCYYEKEKT